MASWHWRFPRSVPREAKGGIKAQSRRGGFGESWWAKRWIEVLEGFEIGARLDRGRAYARRGQVLKITVGKGRVTGQVQGSRSQPYQVSIKVKMIPESGWKKLAHALGRQAIFAAQLLAGKMPENIESVFQRAKLSLFPQRLRDLETECSCPDWSNPCKHIAAVYFLLGEEFDRDPFLIFTLRGLTREELLARLPRTGGSARTEDRVAPAGGEDSSRPLATDPAAFWGGGRPPEGLYGEVSAQPGEAALVKRLGSFPLWRGERRFLEVMAEIYRDAAAAGLEVLAGQANRARPHETRSPRPSGLHSARPLNGSPDHRPRSTGSRPRSEMATGPR
jgi:uncharacterized Zn finger protein